MVRGLVRRFWEIKNQEGLGSALQSTQVFILTRENKRILKLLYKFETIKNSHLSLTFLQIYFRIRNNLFSNFSDADPLKVIHVDPSNIEYHYHGRPQKFGEVQGGDWDLTNKPFDSTVKYTQDLAEKIEIEGYRNQLDLFCEDPNKAWRKNNDAIHPYLNEIAINIGRDGRMGKKSSGGHRLSVAKELGLDEVPVVVRTRHRGWQDIRDEIRMADSVRDLPEGVTRHLDHPDLVDIHIEK